MNASLCIFYHGVPQWYVSRLYLFMGNGIVCEDYIYCLNNAAVISLLESCIVVWYNGIACQARLLRRAVKSQSHCYGDGCTVQNGQVRAE